ncbi:hypothetical protein [Variovorax sp. J31P207]|nr:hypothetical protein [Variovorax sp. J31P207]MDM0066855.1 hypothetical protein [Variovorax sp. J31P207]
MHAANFPGALDLAGFGFTVSPVDRKPIQQFACGWRHLLAIGQNAGSR